MAGQFQALLLRPQGQRVQRVAQRVAQVEVDLIQVQLAGLDLGEIEDVVDDRQQRVGRFLTISRYSRCSESACVSRASSVMPMMPFMGVRISWLMLARNSLLARLAASAASAGFAHLLFGLLALR